jgi:hypothetical protein
MGKKVVEGQQLAQCVRVHSFMKGEGKDRTEYVFYTLSLDGAEFDVFGTEYFKAEEGKYYRPVIDVIASGYMDKLGRPRGRMSPIINWVEAV